MNDDFPIPPRHLAGKQGGLPVAVVAAMVVVAGVAGWSLYAALQAQSRAAGLEERLAARVAEITGREDTLAAQDRQLADTLGSLTTGQADIGKRVDGLYGVRRGGLLATEAEHLVRLAAQRLALMQDPAGALSLLDAADAAIRDIRDADTHAARAALAADREPLRTMAGLDVEALYLRLAALPLQVDGMVMRQGKAADGARVAPAATPTAAAPAAEQGWWERMTARLATLVTIRRVDARLEPMVTGDERALAAQNFRLLVEQAQIALLQRRANVYAHSLEQADSWLARMAGGDPAVRSALHREISSLRAVDIGQRAPDLSASLAATRALAARLLPDTDSQP